MIKATDRKVTRAQPLAIDIRIIQTQNLIKATLAGQLDRQKMKKLFREIASAAAPLGDYQIILDSRKTQSGMSAHDLWELAAELSNLGKAFSRKTAVICPRERFDRVGFFALCAQNRGFLVNVFTSFEDAIEWLNTKGP